MATTSDPADPMDVSTDIKSQHMLETTTWIMFIRRIMNHTYVHVNQFGNSAYLISTLLPEARLTVCEIARPDADLTEPTIAPAPFLPRYLARVLPFMHSSPTAPDDSSTTDASRPSVGVFPSDSPSEELYASKEEAEDAYDLAKDYQVSS